jgi:hypothetical protein
MAHIWLLGSHSFIGHKYGPATLSAATISGNCDLGIVSNSHFAFGTNCTINAQILSTIVIKILGYFA